MKNFGRNDDNDDFNEIEYSDNYEEEHKEEKLVELNEKQQNILNFVYENYAVSPTVIARNFNISSSEAAITLSYLLVNGFIEKDDIIGL